METDEIFKILEYVAIGVGFILSVAFGYKMFKKVMNQHGISSTVAQNAGMNTATGATNIPPSQPQTDPFGAPQLPPPPPYSGYGNSAYQSQFTPMQTNFS